MGGRGRPSVYFRRPDELSVLRSTYEKLARELSQENYRNLHSQLAYQAGFMEAVDRYIKPKKRSEDTAAEDSMLQDIID